MKKSRFSEEQIAYALRLAESGIPALAEETDDRRHESDLRHGLLFLPVRDGLSERPLNATR